MTSAPSRSDRRAALLVALAAALVWWTWVSVVRDTPLPSLAALLASRQETAHIEGDAELEIDVAWGGSPSDGALVRVFHVAEGRTFLLRSGTTKAGALSLEGLPAGEVWVVVYQAGAARWARRVLLAPGANRVEVDLEAARFLAVRVTGPPISGEGTGEDEPQAGARISIDGGDLPFVADTDAAGLATFERLPRAAVRVRVRKPGFEEASVLAQADQRQLEVRLERMGSLRVTVVDEDDAPAAGATVTIAGAALWPARSFETGEDGTAIVTGLRASSYDLKARLGDLVSATEVGVEVRRGVRAEARLVVKPGRMLLVRVTDGEGEDAPGVEGASVIVAEQGLSSFPIEAKTGPAGYAPIGPLSDDPVTVSARAPDFVPVTALRVPSFAEEFQVPLLRGGVLRGEVVDDRGYPVGGATIEIVGADPYGMPIDEVARLTEFRDAHFEAMLAGPRPLIPMGELGVMPGPIPDIPRAGAPGAQAVAGGVPWVTADDGTFEASPVTPGRVQAIVRHPGYVEGVSEIVTLLPGGEAFVRVVLRQGGRLEGRVLEKDRSPVEGARVVVSALEGSFEVSTLTGPDGTFSFAAVPGEVVVTVTRPGSLDPVARLEVDVEEGGSRDVEILLPEAREPATLRVLDDRGYPVSGAQVRVLSLELESDIRRTLFTNEDGDCEIEGAVGLPLRLTVTHPGFGPLVASFDAMPASGEVELPGALVVVGRVTSEGRAGVEGAAVQVIAPWGTRRAVTDADGMYRLADLPAGALRFVVDAPGHVSLDVKRDVDGDRTRDVELGDLELELAGEVEGEVLDGRGDGVAGARVAWGRVPSYLPLGSLPPRMAVTDRKGRFTLRGLPEGSLELEAALVDVGRGAATVVVRAGRATKDVRIELDPADAPRGDLRTQASLAVTLGERDGRVVVMMVPPGAEAEAGGLEVDDALLDVNGARPRTLEQARKALTGPLSQDLILKVDRGGQEERLRVRRERVRR